jgi:hypothetical protein
VLAKRDELGKILGKRNRKVGVGVQCPGDRCTYNGYTKAPATDYDDTAVGRSRTHATEIQGREGRWVRRGGE